jgi:hypothetical protein
MFLREIPGIAVYELLSMRGYPGLGAFSKGSDF